jgi:uncharacterized membrane protein (DUF106 family)
MGAILLVWAVDLMEIITLASKAFATYYLLQRNFIPKHSPFHFSLLILLDNNQKPIDNIPYP